MMISENINVSEKPSTHHSTVLVDSGAATSSGEIPTFPSTVVNKNHTINNNTSNLDETTNIFSKVLLPTSTKNPKTLKDNKNDIQKSASGIEYHSGTTYVPHFSRLYFISYVLRLDIFFNYAEFYS
ncbi:unnamed protein product [Rotaria sp. Silwood1]|nr:unnamed protein product [Rotaria sp. Silwood1]